MSVNSTVASTLLLPGEELGDLLEGLAPWFDEVVHVTARQLNVFRTGNTVGDVNARCRRDGLVTGVMDDEGRYAAGGKHCPNVQLGQERHN